MEVIRSFLGHDGFYLRFINNSYKIANLLWKLLQKEVKFLFDSQSIWVPEKQLAYIIMSRNWCLSFEAICNASGAVLGTVLGQSQEKILLPIYYARKLLNPTQNNYTFAEQELFVVEFIFDKFWSYFLRMTVMHTNHTTHM